MMPATFEDALREWDCKMILGRPCNDQVMAQHHFVYPKTQETSVPYTTRPGRKGNHTDEDTW